MTDVIAGSIDSLVLNYAVQSGFSNEDLDTLHRIWEYEGAAYKGQNPAASDDEIHGFQRNEALKYITKVADAKSIS